MPDLTIETAWTCRTNILWETVAPGSSGMYRVAWERLPENAESQYGWTCECKSFKYRGSCKHIAMVQAAKHNPLAHDRFKRCGWNAELDTTAEAGEHDGEPCCPDCGGPVEAIQVAV